MDLRQLSALVGVAEEGSFSGAADALHTVQSNVSAHVARLERELGTLLVDRASGHLTEEGQVVVARARRVADELEGLVADVAGMRHEVGGTVRVGMIGTTARWLAPALLGRVATDHPHLRLVVVEGITSTLDPQLASGRLDLAVVNLPAPEELTTDPLFEEDLVLVVEDGHPLAGRGTLGMDELAAERLLLPLPGTAFRDELDAAVRRAGLTLVPRAELDGIRLIASLTFEGYGPAVLPATAVPAFLRDRWRLVRVEGLPRRLVGVAKRRRVLPSPQARALLDILHDMMGDPASVAEGLHSPTPPHTHVP